MKIVQVINSTLPVSLYGGTERVVWYLGNELKQLGHEVIFLCKKGSQSSFAEIIEIDESQNIISQIPKNVDIVHFHSNFNELSELDIPYVITIHGNVNDQTAFDKNTIFVSKNHAERYGSVSYVHNGLDWNDYSVPDLEKKRDYFHFLGNASWRVKNVVGAIEVIKKAKEKIKILGGVRFNFNMGIRFTFTPRANFCGMIGEKKKDLIMMKSKGLVFPVKWHEPFGLAIIESLYFGCPVFGTPYGSLPELVNDKVGFLSSSENELVQAVKNAEKYDKQYCHQYAKENFNSKIMALKYLKKYNQVIGGSNLNTEAPILKVIQQEKFLPYTK